MLNKILELASLLAIAYLIYSVVYNPSSYLIYSIYVVVLSILLIWTATHNITNKIPNQPANLFAIGFIMLNYPIYKYLHVDNMTTIEQLSIIFLSVFVTFIIWMAIMTMIVQASFLLFDLDGVDIQIDDPYNDPHAARILNNED